MGDSRTVPVVAIVAGLMRWCECRRAEHGDASASRIADAVIDQPPPVARSRCSRECTGCNVAVGVQQQSPSARGQYRHWLCNAADITAHVVAGRRHVCRRSQETFFVMDGFGKCGLPLTAGVIDAVRSVGEARTFGIWVAERRHDWPPAGTRAAVRRGNKVQFAQFLTKAIIGESFNLEDGVEIVGVRNAVEDIHRWESAGDYPVNVSGNPGRHPRAPSR